MNVTLLNVLRRFVNCSRRGSGPLVIQVKWRNKRETNERRIKKKKNGTIFTFATMEFNFIYDRTLPHINVFRIVNCTLTIFLFLSGLFFFITNNLFVAGGVCLLPILHPPHDVRDNPIFPVLCIHNTNGTYFFSFLPSLSLSLSLSLISCCCLLSFLSVINYILFSQWHTTFMLLPFIE